MKNWKNSQFENRNIDFSIYLVLSRYSNILINFSCSEQLNKLQNELWNSSNEINSRKKRSQHKITDLGVESQCIDLEAINFLLIPGTYRFQWIIQLGFIRSGENIVGSSKKGNEIIPWSIQWIILQKHMVTENVTFTVKMKRNENNVLKVEKTVDFQYNFFRMFLVRVDLFIFRMYNL